MRGTIAILAVALLGAASAASAGYWVGSGDGTGNWNLNTNWSDNTVPISGDVTTDGANTLNPSVIRVVNGDNYVVGGLYAGSLANKDTAVEINGGALQVTGTTCLGYTATTTDPSPNLSGIGRLKINGGSLTLGSDTASASLRLGYFYYGTKSYLDFSSGSFTVMNGGPTTGSAITIANTPQGNVGEFWVHAGQAHPLDLRRGAVAGSITVGGKANGTNLPGKVALLKLGDSAGNPGYITESGAGANGWGISIGVNDQIGTIQGYGVIQASKGFTSFQGTVIADTYGASGDRVLDLSGCPTITASYRATNTNGDGWYAHSRSSILWPSMTPATGSNKWAIFGDDTNVANTQLTRKGVNAMGFKFASVTTADAVTASLMAPDVSTLPVSITGSTVAPLSVYKVSAGSNLAFTTFQLNFVYDFLAMGGDAAEANLKIWAGDGAGAWTDITISTGPATASNMIKSATGQTALSTYYVISTAAPNGVPEPATMAMLVLGSMGVLLRRRRN